MLFHGCKFRAHIGRGKVRGGGGLGGCPDALAVSDAGACGRNAVNVVTVAELRGYRNSVGRGARKESRTEFTGLLSIARVNQIAVACVMLATRKLVGSDA